MDYDDLFDYLVATDTLDEFLGLEKEESNNIEEDNEEEEDQDEI